MLALLLAAAGCGSDQAAPAPTVTDAAMSPGISRKQSREYTRFKNRQ